MPRVRYMNKTQYQIFHLWLYPSFSATGSIRGMKKMYYGENALLVRSGSYIYKVPATVYYCAK